MLLAAGLLASLGPAIQFQTAMANVVKTVEAAPSQIATMRSEILSLASVMPATASDIADVAAAAGQLGVSASDVVEFSEVMVQLGTATNLSATEAATSLARFQNVLQIPIRDTPRLAAALVELGNNSAATESEILTLALRLAGAGKQIGLTGEEVLGLSAAMKSLGIESESGGSSLSRVIQDIIRAVETGSPKLTIFAETAGLTSAEFANLVENDPSQALLAFIQGLQGIEASGGSVLSVLSALNLDSIRLLRSLSALVVGGDTLERSLERVSNEAEFGGALLEEYGRFAETTASRIEILKGRVNNLAIAFGTPALGAVVGVVDAIGDGIVRLTEIFGPAGEEAVKLIGNLSDGFSDLFGILTQGESASTIESFLTALAVTLNSLLLIANQMPPPLLATVAALVLLGKTGGLRVGLGLAGDALFVLRAKAAGATVALNGTTLSMSGLGFAALRVAGPLIAVAAAAALVGSAFVGSKRKAQDLERSLVDASNAASDTGDYEAFTAALERQRVELAKADAAGGTYTSGLGRIGNAIKGAVQNITPFTENTISDATEGFNSLADSMRLAEQVAINFNVRDLAQQFDSTEASVFAVASELGVLNDLVQVGTVQFDQASVKIQKAVAAYDGLSVATNRSIDDLLANGLAVEDLAKRYGVSVGSIISIANEAGIAQDELTDIERYADVDAALSSVVAAHARLAEAIGVSVDQIRAERDAVLGLIAANSDLIKSLDAVDTAREAAAFQQRNLNEATAAYDDAVEAYRKGESTIESVAEAQRDLVAATAAATGSAEQARRTQNELTEQLFDLGIEGGEAADRLFDVATNLGVLSDVEIGDISLKGLSNLEATERQLDRLREQVREPIIARIEAETGQSREAIIEALALGDEWAVSVFRSVVGTDITPAELGFEQAFVEGAAWDAFAPVAELGLDPTGAIAEFEAAFQQGAAWDALAPVANIGADKAAADLEFAEANVLGAQWEALVALASIDADGTGADEEFDKQFERGREFDVSTFLATVAIDDQASIVADRIQERIDAIRGKTVTVNVVGGGGGGTSIQQANGGIVQFSGGGFAGQAERPGSAKIYAAATPYRIFAEPETGGEAYIPLAHQKRPRSIAIWRETGRRLGVMENGGIQSGVRSFASGGFSGSGATVNSGSTSFSFDTRVSVLIPDSPGLDANEVGRIVGVEVEKKMVQVQVDLGNR